jgi:hypothetical protein
LQITSFKSDVMSFKLVGVDLVDTRVNSNDVISWKDATSPIETPSR